ncbi:MAG: hypothetical protein RLZZ501_37 [Pseudomonadota bacterium]
MAGFCFQRAQQRGGQPVPLAVQRRVEIDHLARKVGKFERQNLGGGEGEAGPGRPGLVSQRRPAAQADRNGPAGWPGRRGQRPGQRHRCEQQGVERLVGGLVGGVPGGQDERQQVQDQAGGRSGQPVELARPGFGIGGGAVGDGQAGYRASGRRQPRRQRLSQRMVETEQADGGRSALPPDRRGGQMFAPDRRVQPAGGIGALGRRRVVQAVPRHRHPVFPQLGQSARRPLGLGLGAAAGRRLRRQDRPFGAGGGMAPRHPRQGVGRAKLQQRGVGLGQQRRQPVAEAHRAADQIGPIGGIGRLGWVDPASAGVRQPGDLGGARVRPAKASRNAAAVSSISRE